MNFTIVKVNNKNQVAIYQTLSAHDAFVIAKKYLTKDEFGFHSFNKKIIIFFPNGKIWEKYIN